MSLKKKFRVLSLDGGGSKGAYTLGVLREVEILLGGRPLSGEFDLIYGTSAGSILAALLGLGKKVSEIEQLYLSLIPKVMVRTSRRRTAAFQKCMREIFGDTDFTAFKTNVGLVSTNYELERPMVFKNSREQMHTDDGLFRPGFGCSIADAVIASSAAYPLFNMHTVQTELHGEHLLMDGSYVGNNPMLFALADARGAFKRSPDTIAALSIGVGTYRQSVRGLARSAYFSAWSVRRMSKMFSISSNTIEQLQSVVYSDIPYVRINDDYRQWEYATDVLERDMNKLEQLRRLGQESFSRHEGRIRDILQPQPPLID